MFARKPMNRALLLLLCLALAGSLGTSTSLALDGNAGSMIDAVQGSNEPPGDPQGDDPPLPDPPPGDQVEGSGGNAAPPADEAEGGQDAPDGNGPPGPPPDDVPGTERRAFPWSLLVGVVTLIVSVSIMYWLRRRPGEP